MVLKHRRGEEQALKESEKDQRGRQEEAKSECLRIPAEGGVISSEKGRRQAPTPSEHHNKP